MFRRYSARFVLKIPSFDQIIFSQTTVRSLHLIRKGEKCGKLWVECDEERGVVNCDWEW